MLRNHQLFIGRHDTDRNAAVAPRYPQSCCVVYGVEQDAEPGEPLPDAQPDVAGILRRCPR